MGRGIAARIALAAVVAAAVGLAVLALGVTVVGGQSFADLMVVAGDTADHAHEMFDDSVGRVVVLAVGFALVVSVVLAIWLGRRLARPLTEIGVAARRIAMGDYEARVPRSGPEEVADLADSFNQMAASLAEHEREQRDFIANAAHELRTPLTNLQGYLEALRDGVIVADRQTYQSLWDETQRLVRLAQGLDTLAAQEGDGALDVVDIDLAESIGAAVEFVRPQADRRGLTLRITVPDRLGARANPDHLSQVLSNLLSNAVRYSTAGGTVDIRADRRPTDVLVTVANTSDTIPKDDLDRIFERFYRVEKSRDRSRGGAGLGLAIVRQLVEAAGGKVGAESGAGQTRFWFSLPAA
jgi:two-component system, OmpR family, sensor histidine kinase BaeS